MSLTAVSEIANTLDHMVRSRDVLNEYVRHLLQEEWKGGRPDGEIAKDIGVSGPAINQIRNGKRGIGYSIEGFAAHYAGGSSDKLRADAEAWWKKRPPPTEEPRVVKDERYPNRAAAVGYARAKWRDDPDIEQAIRAIESQGLLGPDLQVDDWIDRIRLKRAELATAKLPHPKVARGVPIDESDLGPPPEPIPKPPKRGK